MISDQLLLFYAYYSFLIYIFFWHKNPSIYKMLKKSYRQIMNDPHGNNSTLKAPKILESTWDMEFWDLLLVDSFMTLKTVALAKIEWFIFPEGGFFLIRQHLSPWILWTTSFVTLRNDFARFFHIRKGRKKLWNNAQLEGGKTRNWRALQANPRFSPLPILYVHPLFSDSPSTRVPSTLSHEGIY